MKTCHLSLATVVLGALAVSYSACSAQGQDNTVPGSGPKGEAGSISSSAGTPATGSAGTPATGSAGTMGNPSAGGPPSFAGSFNTGVGGAVTSGGTSGKAGGSSAGGGPTGAAGGTPVGGCRVAAGVAAELLIDDLEDGDNTIRPLGSRVGYWFTFNDGTATQVPSGAIFMPQTGGHSAMYSAHTSGPAFMTWGAGIGFDFNNTASKSCAYDATAYKGIKFWAKGNVAIKAMVKIPGTTAKKPDGSDAGTCNSTTMCDDHYALTPSPVLTATWKEYTIDFAGGTTFAQEGWGIKVAFDKASILAMQFQVAKTLPFDFSIDDITFY